MTVATMKGIIALTMKKRRVERIRNDISHANRTPDGSAAKAMPKYCPGVTA